MNNFLKDKEFLNTLFLSQEREIYARITALSFNEYPIESIEGKVIDGSINIDGTSAVRRTCNLTLIADGINIKSFYWGVKNKFKLEVGLKNNINSIYDDIVWFKQGIFVITQFDATEDLSKMTIKIQGKDKMCLLNGDVSGNLPFNVDFANEEYIDTLTQKSTFIPVSIKTIIQKALVEFGKEFSHNIILRDIDENGYELLEYRGSKPLYILKDIHTGEYIQMLVDEDVECMYEIREIISIEDYQKIPNKYNFLLNLYEKEDNNYRLNYSKALSNSSYKNYLDEHTGLFKGCISDEFSIIYDDLLEDNEFQGNIPSTIIFIPNPDLQEENTPYKECVIAKFETGDVPGYRVSELIFGGELKANVGDSLTSVLDKIKNKFTNFEYFYDVDGKFIFQKRREYLTTAWSVDDQNNKYLYINAVDNMPTFNFTGNKLVSSISNNPKIIDLKNDYSIWGARDNLAIHLRYAIDEKPTSYKPIRPLKEEHVIITRDEDGNIVNIKTSYKYYDAPEKEPYNEDGLISFKMSYKVLELLEKSEHKTHGLDNVDYNYIKSFLSSDRRWNSQWSKLFYTSGVYYKYNIDRETLKEMIKSIHDTYSMYGQHNTFEVVPANKYTGTLEEWHLIYPYFANYSYSTKDVCNKNGYVIHHKVDWRELIYQMALDFRKLNYTDNYFYYLNQENPWCLNQTGYEQYYIDLEGFWRLLYNPNPSPIFTDEASIEDVKKYTLLLDATQNNDDLDLIYIKNGYAQLENVYDLEDLTANTLYKFSAPEGISEHSIYPFIKSDSCHLNLGDDYYINSVDNSESKEQHSSNNLNDTNYQKLNSISLEQIYKKIIDDSKQTYINYPQYCYEQIKELSDFNEYFMKSNDYIKLSDIKNNNENLWNVYYMSDLYFISYYIQEFLVSLEKLIESKSKTDIGYIDNINNQLKVCMNKITSSEFNYIKKLIYQYYHTFVKKYRDALKKVSNSTYESNICLQKIINNYSNSITNESLPSSSSFTETNFLKLISFLTNINLYTQIVLNSISNNLNQVNCVLTKESQIANSNLEGLKSIINSLSTTLNSTPDLYDDGQVQITRIAIDELKDNLNKNKITLSSAIETAQSIIDDIKLLDSYKTALQNKIYESFSLTDNTNFETLSNLLHKIKNLPIIFTTNNQSIIEEALFYEGKQLLTITQADEVNNYKIRTSNLQKNIVRYNTDNFNEIKGQDFIYEPIQYYIATFGFNQNEIEGNFWSTDIYDSPESLIFWFDFLDPNTSDLSKYSVPTIGTRSKVVNDKDVKLIHHKEIPNIIFTTANDNSSGAVGYSYINLNYNLYNSFVVSSKGKTAKERLDELLYNYSYCQQNINMSIVPIYNLDVNTRIHVEHQLNNIDGEYLINKITIPLNYKKMMSVSAVKSVNSIT